MFPQYRVITICPSRAVSSDLDVVVFIGQTSCISVHVPDIVQNIS